MENNGNDVNALISTSLFPLLAKTKKAPKVPLKTFERNWEAHLERRKSKYDIRKIVCPENLELRYSEDSEFGISVFANRDHRDTTLFGPFSVSEQCRSLRGGGRAAAAVGAPPQTPAPSPQECTLAVGSAPGPPARTPPPNDPPSNKAAI